MTSVIFILLKELLKLYDFEIVSEILPRLYAINCNFIKLLIKVDKFHPCLINSHKIVRMIFESRTNYLIL